MPNLTIKDIARISGCSVSTISRVINDRPDVRPETKEHVLKVMREAGFVPNTNARQLKIQQSRSVVFVVKGTRNLFFSDFLVQLQRAATLYGYNGIISYIDENANEKGCGSIVVIENVFHYKQVIPLQMGDNVIGRYMKGSKINCPIETVDPSIDMTHCVINVSRDKHGRLKYILRDGPSYTGTFVDNVILGDRERRVIEDGTLFTLGATSIILRTPDSEDE